MGLFGGSNEQVSNATKQELMEALRSEFVLQNLQELLVKLNEKCFKGCVTKPDGSLSDHDYSCLGKCSDRYVQAWNTVSATYKDEITKDKANLSGLGKNA